MLKEFIDQYLGGELHIGNHEKPDDLRCCLLEAVSLYKGQEKTDDPLVAGLPDFRLINDRLDTEDLAGEMVALYEKYKDFESWDKDRREVLHEKIRVFSEYKGPTRYYNDPLFTCIIVDLLHACGPRAAYNFLMEVEI